MKSPVIAYVGWLLLLSALGFYVYGIYEAIRLSWPDKHIGTDEYSPVLESVISSLQALFLTNLGMLLGISVAKPQSEVAKQLMLGRLGGNNAQALQVTDPLLVRDIIQFFALALYILSLIGCVVTWAANHFSSKPEEVVPLVSASGKMFFGVVLAYLTAVLSRPTT